MCKIGETLMATVLTGADVVFSLQVKWWWQIQEFTNVGEQDTASFTLSNIVYGNSTYFLSQNALNGSTIDGVAYGGANGIDIRKWNIDSDADHRYPVPAMALNDAVDLTFTNIAGQSADLELIAEGPAVLQIG